MGRIKVVRYLLVVVLVVVIFSSASWAKTKVDLTADDVQYYKQENLVVATGNANLKTSEIDLSADKLEIDMNKEQVIATDNVKVKDDDGTIESEKLEYDLKLAEGLFIEAESIIVDDSLNDELYLTSPKINHSQDKSELEDVVSTSCDYDHSHYEITSSSIVIYPDDKIIAYNNFIWEFNGTVPILYSPILVYSLKNEQQVLEHEIGRSAKRGWFLKNTYNYHLANNYENVLANQLAEDQGQLYVDYFEETGWALGLKHYYHYQEDKHAYFYIYTEQDKLNPSYSPLVTAELDSYLKEHNLTRKYNLKYSNHKSNYWSNPQNVTDIDFEFSQDNEWENLESEVDFNYDKNSSYEHKTDSNINLSGDLSSQDELEVDINHVFEQDNDSQSNMERNYDLAIEYDRELSKEHYGDDLELDLDYDYDESRDILEEHGADLAVKKHFTEEHYFDYQYNYDNPLDKGLIEDNYVEEIEDDKIGELHYLEFGKDQGNSFYDWELITQSFQQDGEIGYYYLPEVEGTIYPGSIWNNKYVSNFDLSLGGANKYANSWGRREQNAYYKLGYKDVVSAPLNNSIIIDQQLQQDIYSNGLMRWFHESRLEFNTKILENWNNELKYNYNFGQGKAPDRFRQKEEKHTIDERLEWKTDDSRFYIKTAYDLLDETYDPLKSELNIEFNEHYDWQAAVTYDLNDDLFEKATTALDVEYNDLTYNTDAEFDLNESKMIQWDNELDWEFGPSEWEWNLALKNSYDFEKEEHTTAKISIEKQLHCRSVSLSYDHSKEEIRFKYDILAFPQGRAEIGSNEEEGWLFNEEGELGGFLDDVKKE
ncbi:MAG: OstA-like protein [Bacillota bacterium]